MYQFGHRFTGTHYNDMIMCAIASQITSLTIVYSIVYSDVDQRKHQSFASLAFVRGIHRGPVNSRTNGQLRGKCFHLMTSSWISIGYQYPSFGRVTSLAQIVACILLRVKQLSESVLTYCQLDPMEQISIESFSKSKLFMHKNAFKNSAWKMALFFSVSMC